MSLFLSGTLFKIPIEKYMVCFCDVNVECVKCLPFVAFSVFGLLVLVTGCCTVASVPFRREVENASM